MAQVPENPKAGAVVAAVQATEGDVEENNAVAANAAPPVGPCSPRLAFYTLCSLLSQLVPGSRFYFSYPGFLALPFVS